MSTPRLLLLPPTLLLFAAAAGCQDKVIREESEAPLVVTISSPADGASFIEGEQILFEALVSAGETTDVASLQHSWIAGSSPLCDTATVAPYSSTYDGSEANGIAECLATFDAEGEYVVEVTVTNPSNSDTTEATTTVVIEYNNPPTVTLNTPSEGDTFTAADQVVVNATVSDVEDDESDLSIQVTSSRDGDLEAFESPSTAGDYTEAFGLTSGSHLVKVIATDTAGKTGEAYATVYINSPPGQPLVEISPDPAISGDTLSASITATATDPDGDSLSYDYTWLVDGAEYSTGVPSVPANIIQRGEYWEVRVSANDGYDSGPEASAAITIGNALPEILSVSLNPSTPGTEDDVVAEPQNWTDPEGDPERYRYEWTFNGALDASESTDTFPSHRTTRGDTLQVTVTPFDDYGDGASVTSGVITVGNSAPSQPAVLVSPSVPERTDDLVCEIVTYSTDDDGDPIEYSYSWLRDGSVTVETSNVVNSAATSDGETWECQVTASDGEDDGVPGTDSVYIEDFTAPDPPVLDDLSPYRNEDTATVTGVCEGNCALEFTVEEVGLGSFTEIGTCNPSGTLSLTVDLTRGYTTEVTATCEDASGNISADSNTVSTQACDPYDEYENASGYGNTAGSAIAEWDVLSDDGTVTISIVANALDDSDEDWYLINTYDDTHPTDEYWFELYLFEAELVEGDDAYQIEVYNGDVSLTTDVCSGSTYSQFDWYFEDPTWGRGQYCNPTTENVDYTDCPDFSIDWYVKVSRRSDADPSCGQYELEITNGMW